MRKVLSLMLGVGFGTGVGLLLVKFLPSISREKLTANLKRGWQETMNDARQASQQRRRELEADLAARLSKKDLT